MRINSNTIENGCWFRGRLINSKYPKRLRCLYKVFNKIHDIETNETWEQDQIIKDFVNCTINIEYIPYTHEQRLLYDVDYAKKFKHVELDVKFEKSCTNKIIAER